MKVENNDNFEKVSSVNVTRRRGKKGIFSREYSDKCVYSAIQLHLTIERDIFNFICFFKQIIIIALNVIGSLETF